MSDVNQVEPGSIAAWRMAIRPQTLPVSIGPVLVGTAVAHVEGALQVGPAIAAGLGALFLQIGSNFANDVFDFEKGADTADRIGPPRAAVLGLLSPAQLKAGMGVVFALATVAGLYLSSVAGPAILAVGFVSILAAIAFERMLSERVQLVALARKHVTCLEIVLPQRHHVVDQAVPLL